MVYIFAVPNWSEIQEWMIIEGVVEPRGAGSSSVWSCFNFYKQKSLTQWKEISAANTEVAMK